MNIAGGKSDAPEFERQFLGELVEELVSFRTAFEQLVRRSAGCLLAHKHPHALTPASIQGAKDDICWAFTLLKHIRFAQVNGLTSFKQEEAQPLVQKALEAIDDMNNALSLCKDVRHCPSPLRMTVRYTEAWSMQILPVPPKPGHTAAARCQPTFSLTAPCSLC